MRVIFAFVLLGLLVPHAHAQDKPAWGTIKGRVVWGGEKLPVREVLKVNSLDAAAILRHNPTADRSQKTILDDAILVHPRHWGMQNVYVWLLTDPPGGKLPMHPRFKEFSKEAMLEMWYGSFKPRALAMREGQVLVVKSTGIDHVLRLDGIAGVNAGGVWLVPANKELMVKDLKADRLPMPVTCFIRNWMGGRVAVFNHPYYAVTNARGQFEIKDAPAGKVRIMIYHESFGYRLGAKSKDGEPITIQPGAVTDLRELKMGA